MAIYGPFEVHFAALAQNNYAEVMHHLPNVPMQVLAARYNRQLLSRTGNLKRSLIL